MSYYEWRGSATIGMITTNGPLVRLKVDENTLTLEVPFKGDFMFTPNQIVDIKTTGFIPIICKGIKISHNVSNYPAEIIFWHFSWNTEWLVSILNRMGYGTKNH